MASHLPCSGSAKVTTGRNSTAYLVCGVYILYNVSDLHNPLVESDARAAGHGQTRETLC